MKYIKHFENLEDDGTLIEISLGKYIKLTSYKCS